jgi:hypothetical protein
LDISQDDETIFWWIEGPEVGAKHHDAEVDVHVVVVLFHTLFERVGQILAETHVYCIGEHRFASSVKEYYQ